MTNDLKNKTVAIDLGTKSESLNNAHDPLPLLDPVTNEPLIDPVVISHPAVHPVLYNRSTVINAVEKGELKVFGITTKRRQFPIGV